MNYYDADPLLNFSMKQERLKSTYNGSPSVYADGRPLEIFYETTTHTPLFVFGTVVYLKYQGSYLVIRQTKEDRAVNTLVGLGGKVRSVISGKISTTEKANMLDIIKAYENSSLGTEEQFRDAACREVMEETSTYEIDSNGNYTKNIIKPGLVLNADAIKNIGISEIRIITEQKEESWMIVNYEYELTDEEYQFVESHIDKVNREGELIWLTYAKLLTKLSAADQLIVQVSNPNHIVSEIRDGINNHNILRSRLRTDSQDKIVTYINFEPVYYNDDEYVYFLEVHLPQVDHKCS